MLLALIKPPWEFPIILHFGGWQLHIHQLFDLLAYSLGFRFYLALKKKAKGPSLPIEQTAWLFVGCIFGALIGAKLLAWAEAPVLYWQLRHDPVFWLGGKTIVGGLLGGWVGIEIVKKILGITTSTGDLYVFPLILGMAIGRIGCFLTGLPDHTYGVPTQLPWGIDFGDGIGRHPTQLYEILFLIGLGLFLWRKKASLPVPGQLFRWFMIGYLAMRLSIEFLKPRLTVFCGLSPIQWACLFSILICWLSLSKLATLSVTREAHA